MPSPGDAHLPDPLTVQHGSTNFTRPSPRRLALLRLELHVSRRVDLPSSPSVPSSPARPGAGLATSRVSRAEAAI